MKASHHWFTLASILITSVAGAVDIPGAMSALIKDPPSISRIVHPRASFTFKTPGAIIEGKDFIACLELKSHPKKRSTYRFRTYSKHFKLEVSGDGEVFERYFSVADPASDSGDKQLIDRDSQLEIHAGLFKVDWSAGNHIYYTTAEVTVSPGSEDDYVLKTKIAKVE